VDLRRRCRVSRGAAALALLTLALVSCSDHDPRAEASTTTRPPTAAPNAGPTGLWDGDWDRLFAIVNQTTYAQYLAARPEARDEVERTYRTVLSRVITKPASVLLPDLSGAKEVALYVTCHGEHPFQVKVLDRHGKTATYYGGGSCGGDALVSGRFPISKLDKASRAHASLEVKITPFVPYTLSVFIVPRYRGRA
jgi:hypothetical protein